MKIALIVCTTLVLIVLISCVANVVKECSFNKWKAKNPEAFKIPVELKEIKKNKED